MKRRETLLFVPEILGVLRRAWVVVLAAALLFGGVAYVTRDRGGISAYTATTSVQINTPGYDMTNVDSKLNADEIPLARALAASIAEMGVTDGMINEMRTYFAQNGWEDLAAYQNDEIRAMITYEYESGTQKVTVVAEAKTDMLAVHLATAVAAVMDASLTPIIGEFVVIVQSYVTAAVPVLRAGDSVIKLGVMAIIGAVLGYIAAYLFFLFDPRVRCAAAIRQVSDERLPLLPALSDKNREGVDTLRAAIAARLPRTGTATVGAAYAGTDGAALTAALGASYARLGHRVLLVDAAENGLDAILPSVASKQLPAGAALTCLPADGTPVFGSPAFRTYLAALQGEYDVILLHLGDVATALPVALTAAPMTDGVLIALSPAAHRRTAGAALDALETAAAPLLGITAIS